MFSKGTKVRIFGSPARKEPTTCYTETISFDGGDEKLFRYGAVGKDGSFINTEKAKGAAANTEKVEVSASVPDLSGDWGEPIADGPPRAYAGRGPKIERTQAAKDVGGNWTSKDNPRFKCEATNIILDYRFDQMVNQITQSKDMLEIKYGFMDMVRKIHIGGAFPEKIEPSNVGYSVGKWEGEKLVVTTKGFAEGGFLSVIGGRSKHSLPYSTDMEVSETFYIDKAGELVREYTITDDKYLAKPYTHLDKSVSMNGQFYPFECDDLTVEEGR